MLKNSFDKNGNRLKGATIVTRFVSEQGGIENLVNSTYQAGFINGRSQGAREAAAYVEQLFRGVKPKRKK
jgi:hypothetical protein